MKYSDRPIKRPSDDLLGRAGFALSIAKSIDSLQINKDGFVLSIIGPWGSGKSSVVELICRYLNHFEMQRTYLKKNVANANGISLDRLEELAIEYEVVEKRVIDEELKGGDPSLWNYLNQEAAFRGVTGSQERAALAGEYWSLLCATRAIQTLNIVRFSPWLLTGHF